MTVREFIKLKVEVNEIEDRLRILDPTNSIENKEIGVAINRLHEIFNKLEDSNKKPKLEIVK
jgi:hypothetical protein